MILYKKLAAAFLAFSILIIGSPAFTVRANEYPEETGTQVPGEAPTFHAYIEYTPQGYVVKGSFQDFLPDTSLVRTMYSLDGVNYQACAVTWDLSGLESEDMDLLERMQNQTCLYDSHEPLKSYLAGKIDRFYLKLLITMENGITYESQAAAIDRGAPQPVPEDASLYALFPAALRVRETRPYRCYGRYQLTVNADAAPEDIFSLLPDTLPIEVQVLPNDMGSAAICTVDCPVTWKSFSLPPLTAGESVTIADAAEEIVVPGGTSLNTPMGIFQLKEPLHISPDLPIVELRLNVAAEDGNPAGILSLENDGLEMAFTLKPTGATAIRAYTISEGEDEWTELSGLLPAEAMNAQFSTANSSYALVLDKTSEPLRSYLAAEAAGDEPTPFFIGLKIEGGVYNGRQLVLAWPDTYVPLRKLPEVGGSGGNEGNAGADNKDDSTAEGQRPNLPQSPSDNEGGQATDLPPTQADVEGGQPSGLPQSTENKDGTPPGPSHDADNAGSTPSGPSHDADNVGSLPLEPSRGTENKEDGVQTEPPQETEDSGIKQQPDIPPDQKDTESGQPPKLPQDQESSAGRPPICLTAPHPLRHRLLQAVAPTEVPRQQIWRQMQSPTHRPGPAHKKTSLPNMRQMLSPLPFQTHRAAIPAGTAMSLLSLRL